MSVRYNVQYRRMPPIRDQALPSSLCPSLKPGRVPGSNTLGHHDLLAVLRGGFRPQRGMRTDLIGPTPSPHAFTMVLVTVGSVKGLIGMQHIRLQAGDLALLPPDGNGKLVGESPDNAVVALRFSPDLLEHVALPRLSECRGHCTQEAIPVQHLAPAEVDRIAAIIGRIEKRVEELPTHLFGFELMMNAFTELLLEVLHLSRHDMNTDATSAGRAEELTHRFLQLAQQHHPARRPLSFYSDRLFVTTKHLSETVKAVTGRTAGKILHELLAGEARRLLGTNRLSISEVAYRLNFEEPSQFSKFFHRMTGTSPRTFRRMALVGEV